MNKIRNKLGKFVKGHPHLKPKNELNLYETHKKIKPFNLTKEETAYIAGMTDGEGCINIAKQKQYKRMSLTYHLRIQISNTTEEIINYLLTKLGGSKSFHKGKGRNKDYWDWRITDITSEKLLKEIQPYLIIKKYQCELALKFRETYYRVRETYKNTQELNNTREIFYLKMKELNKRGK